VLIEERTVTVQVGMTHNQGLAAIEGVSEHFELIPH
jgi:hypothetical protein